MSVIERPSKATALQYLDEAMGEVENVDINNDGKSTGIITCAGGPYSYGAYVLIKMARMIGWDGPIQVWHRGADEPLDYYVFKSLDVEIYNCSVEAKKLGLKKPDGWEAKAFACCNSYLSTFLFLDADAYPVSNLQSCFEYAKEHGELFWPDDPNDNLQWGTFNLDRPQEGTYAAINGGQWLLNKNLRQEEFKLYAALNRFGKNKLYNYMHGDQDLQRLAWYLLGRDYNIPSNQILKTKGVWTYTFPKDTSVISHRIGCKMAPEGHFPGRTFYGPVRNAPLEKYAVKFYTEALNAIGVNTR